MTYRFEAGRIYRMPTHFGPAPGPRQLPDGIVPDPKHSHHRVSVAASFLTDATLLERHLPEGFALTGERRDREMSLHERDRLARAS